MENWYGSYDFSLKFQVWTFESQAPFFASPCIDQSAGIAWIGSQDGKLFKINIKDGKRIGELYLRSALTSGFICSNPKASFLTICESKGNVHIDSNVQELSILWTTKMPFVLPWCFQANSILLQLLPRKDLS